MLEVAKHPSPPGKHKTSSATLACRIVSPTELHAGSIPVIGSLG
jgi:hypothetical protein